MSGNQADNLKEIGLTHFRNGAYQDALVSFEAAFQTYDAIDDNLGKAEMLNNIGVIQVRQKNHEKAVSALNKAQTIFAAIGDIDRQAQTLGNLGDLFTARRKYKEAGIHYSEAAQLFAKIGERQKQANVLRTYSLMTMRQRNLISAINLMTESLRIRPNRSLGQKLFFLLLRIVTRLMEGR